jgi:hypothetical protein
MARDILSDFTPSVDMVGQIASSIADHGKRTASSTDGDMLEAVAILDEVLKHIYEENSAMHALVSVGPEDFESISAELFITWLERERSNRSMALTSLVMCSSDEEISNARPSNGEMPYSNIIRPQTISLTMPKAKSLASRLLSRVVLVGGDFRPENSPLRSSATRKYCGHQSIFSTVKPGISFEARTHCLTDFVHNTDTWVLIFCDPESCTSDEVAEKVAAAIADDPEVVALGKESAQNGQARGPYLITVRSAD